MRAATAELAVLGVGQTVSTTESCTSYQATTGILSEAFALLRSAGLKLDEMSGRPTSISSPNYARRNNASGRRISRGR